MARATASVDRLAWDRQGITLRLQQCAPSLDPRDRAALVEACLNAPSFKLTEEEFFEQIKAQIVPKKGKRR